MAPIPLPVSAEDHRELPASLADLKEQARVEHNDSDRLLMLHLMAATNEAEQFLGVPIMARSLAITLSAFPSDAEGMRLWTPPVRSVTSITYYDTDGVEQTFDVANYYLLSHSAFPTVHLVPNTSWPSTQERENAVTVTYVAGFADKPSAVPAAISAAVLLRAATRYDMAAEAGLGTVAWKAPDELAFKSLLSPFRVVRV